MSAGTVLLVDDEYGVRLAYSRFLRKRGFDVYMASSLAEAREAFYSRPFDVVLLDLNLPDENGIGWIEEIRRERPSTAIVVITGTNDVNVAVEAMRKGADNYLLKPVDMDSLELFLRKGLEIERMRRDFAVMKRAMPADVNPFPGDGSVMREVKRMAEVAAGSHSPVLIQGETGTGKGVLARWIHRQSPRSKGPFVEVNCSTLGGELMASELFGHVKGAFTSALQDKPGLVEVADGGTLFLDEIGDMDLSVQARLLKVLEEKTFRRVGDVRTRSSDFRLICATNHDLEEMVQRGEFRSDLFFRINVLTIRVPPLRERKADLTHLVESVFRMLNHSSGISEDALAALAAYDWPGNIRELRNVLERAVLLSGGRRVEKKHLAGLDGGSSSEPAPEEEWNLEKLERAHIRRAVDYFGGDVNRAAEALGISRATIYRKLKEHS